jgi:hypothetical protein
MSMSMSINKHCDELAEQRDDDDEKLDLELSSEKGPP